MSYLPLSQTIITPQKYGAVGDGVTDCSAAFLAAFTEAANARQSGYGANPRGDSVIYVPAGTYLITEPGSLMANLSLPRMQGLKYVGEGREVSMIVFSPTTADEYLLDNEDTYLHLTFEDMSFYSTVDTASFMKSVSSGGAQNYVFSRCNWQGTWQYGLDLQGTNNNSEMSWFHCGIYGDWTSFLYVGSDVGSDGDQFLNYNFYATQCETSSGNFVDMSYGGNVNVWGGSLIHIGNGSQTTSPEQIFFNMQTTSHYNGTCRLSVTGVRVEHRHNNSQLINCGWTQGNITFSSCDTACWATLLDDPAAVIQAEFGNGQVPEIVFDGCTLMGVHQYHYQLGSYAGSNLATYRSCQICTQDTAAQFVTFVNDDVGNTNAAGMPVVEFDRCKGQSTSNTEAFDTTLNWGVAQNPVFNVRTVSIKQPWGGLPYSVATSTTVNLPLNSVITRVRSWKGVSGSSSSTNFAYTLTNASSTVIATAVGDGTQQWLDGYFYDSGPLGYQCNSDNARSLTLTSSNIDQTATDNMFVIDYLG